MQPAPLPANETARLETLEQLGILDTPPEERFDRLTHLVRDLFGVPIAALSLVDAERQWFKSKLGGSPCRETPRGIAFCAHGILQATPLIVEDALRDPRFADNPLVVGADPIRFYAGAPLLMANGHALGMLCAIDHRPRSFTATDRARLVALARLATDEMELHIANQRMLGELERRRQAEAELARNETRLAAFLRSASDWLWETDADHRLTFLSSEAARLFPGTDLRGKCRWEFAGEQTSPARWARHRAILAAHRPIRRFRYSLVLGNGEVRHVEIDGEPVFAADGRFEGYRGCGRDVTDEVRAAEHTASLSTKLATLEAANIIGMITGKNRRILTANGEFLRIVDRPASALTGRGLYLNDLMHRDGRLAQLESLRQLRQQGRPAAFEAELIRADGSLVPVSVTAVVANRKDGDWLALVQDISERKAAEARIADLAFKDELTGLPNRRAFADALEARLALARAVAAPGALLVLDIDAFKDINDALGHDAGDTLMQTIAARLRATLEANDLVARIGGDEFAVILADRGSKDGVAAVAERILDALAEPLPFAGHELHPSCSIGITRFPDDGSDAEQLLKNADIALYRAKDEGRRRSRFFEPAMLARAIERLAIAGDIRRAVQAREFRAVFQPISGIADRQHRGFEALARWQHPELGLLTPDCFLEAMADAGLIPDLGRLIVEEICDAWHRWTACGFDPGIIAINVAPPQLQDPTFATSLLDTLARRGVPAHRIEVEITENALLDAGRHTHESLTRLRRAGIGIALDDFGTGFASLIHLKRFPIDVLKVDRSFVMEITTDTESLEITSAIINLAHNLGMRVVAEGIETTGQLDRLQRLGADFGQGYLFARPAFAETFDAHLAQIRRPLERAAHPSREAAIQGAALQEASIQGTPAPGTPAHGSSLDLLRASIDTGEAVARLVRA